MSTNVKPMKQGDLLPSLLVRCRYKDTTQDLAAAVAMGTTVVFTMRDRRNPTATPTINRRPATLVSSVTSVVTVRYDWAAGDTNTIGEYWGEFEFTVAGAALTAPTDGYVLVRIEDDLG